MEHLFSHAECICHLIEQTKLGSSICDIFRCREFCDCSKVSLAKGNTQTDMKIKKYTNKLEINGVQALLENENKS